MSSMTVLTEGARARAGAPPGFAAVCKALYGPEVDPQSVWEDVFKLTPDQADLNAHRTIATSATGRISDRRKRQITAGLSTVGAGAGALGLAVGAKEVARHGWRNTPRLTRALVPAEIAGLGGEIAATKILHGDTKHAAPTGRVRGGATKSLVPTGEVAKFSPGALGGLPKIGEVAGGIRSGWSAMRPKAMRGLAIASDKASQKIPKAPMPQETLPGLEHNAVPSTRALKQRAIGSDIGTALGTRTGKVVAGTAGAYGALKVGGALARNRVQGPAPSATDNPYAMYGKRDTVDVEFRGTFSKLDEDKQLAFGWASVTKINGTPVVDKQDDYIDLNDLEEAAYNYVRGSRIGGNMHKRSDSDDGPHQVSDMVESMVFTPEKIEAMGLPRDFPQGWWVGYKIHDPETWSMVKKRERTGFSIHGRGIRKAADLDEIMGYGR